MRALVPAALCLLLASTAPAAEEAKTDPTKADAAKADAAKTEAVKAGFYETPYGKYPRLQILTIADLFDGRQPNIPLVDPSSFRKAARESSGETNFDLPF